jgi:hypothetical protein
MQGSSEGLARIFLGSCMKTQQRIWSKASGWKVQEVSAVEPNLVLLFASRSVFEGGSALSELNAAYPNCSAVAGCSTGGEILGPDIYNDSLVATAIEFEHSTVSTAVEYAADTKSSFECGRRIALRLDGLNLRAMLVFSDGLLVNGSELTGGVNSVLQGRVPVIGGLAGDGERFEVTKVGLNGEYGVGMVVAVGLYGNKLQICHGSEGGWDSFGPKRTVTRSSGNVLAELDGEPALDLYKRYLGEWSSSLPSSALFFPLSLGLSDLMGGEVVRTILSVDTESKTLTFAGDIPQGSTVQLMRANPDRLVSAAGVAAQSAAALGDAQLGILVSCIGRRLVLGNRTVEETELVADVLGPSCAVMGFYSYGEICPLMVGGSTELHNQTMTITTISEAG